MKISFVGFKDNSVNIFPDLEKALSKKISGIELVERFVPFPEDLPIVALECATDSDFVFVFALLEEDEEISTIKQKLIDVELATKTRILKEVIVDEFAGLSEDEFANEKAEAISNYTSLILAILFDERSFMPQEKDYSI